MPGIKEKASDEIEPPGRATPQMGALPSAMKSGGSLQSRKNGGGGGGKAGIMLVVLFLVIGVTVAVFAAQGNRPQEPEKKVVAKPLEAQPEETPEEPEEDTVDPNTLKDEQVKKLMADLKVRAPQLIGKAVRQGEETAYSKTRTAGRTSEKAKEYVTAITQRTLNDVFSSAGVLPSGIRLKYETYELILGDKVSLVRNAVEKGRLRKVAEIQARVIPAAKVPARPFPSDKLAAREAAEAAAQLKKQQEAEKVAAAVAKAKALKAGKKVTPSRPLVPPSPTHVIQEPIPQPADSVEKPVVKPDEKPPVEVEITPPIEYNVPKPSNPGGDDPL